MKNVLTNTTKENILTNVTKENVLTNVTKKNVTNTTKENVLTNVTKENVKGNVTKKQKISMETEGDLKVERMKNIIEKEKRLGEIQLQHEERIIAIKEVHLHEINKLELRASMAKAKLAELILAKEKSSNEHILNNENMS